MLALAVLAVAFAVIVALVVKRRRQDPLVWPLYAKKPLTRPEQVLYHRLVKALPECIVLAQVQASRVLAVTKGENYWRWNNRINRLSFDFVVCLKDSTVVAAIELDDLSHQQFARQEADWRKERALTSAGVPLLRWSVHDLPNEAEIQTAFRGRA